MRSSPGRPSVAGSPSPMIAAFFFVGVFNHFSRQLCAALRFSPINHLALGAFHWSTLLNGLNQTNSSFAIRPQNLSGDLMDSAYILRYCAMDLTWALWENSLDGGNVRPSCCNEVMLLIGAGALFL